MLADRPRAKRRQRGRPRSVDTHRRIVEATTALLDRVPIGKLSIEAIANEAGVGKQTIYKWWGSKSKLVMEAFLLSIERRVPQPATGDVRTDLCALVTASARALRETASGATLAGLIAEAQYDKEIAQEFRQVFLASRRKMVRDFLTRGIERGQVREDIDIELVIDLISGPMWYRLLIRNAPLSDQFAKRLVDAVMAAIESSPLTGKRA